MKKNIIIVVLLLSNVFFGVVAHIQKLEVQSSRLVAEANAAEAERQKLFAEQARAEADKQRVLAEASAQMALDAYQKIQEKYEKKK